MTLGLVFAASLVAFALSAVSGGGAGLLLIPLLARSLPGVAVPAALTLGTVTSTVSKLLLFWRDVRWDIARVFVPGALPGVVLGAMLLRHVEPQLLEVFLGLFLVSNLSALLRPPSAVSTARPTRWWHLAVTGFAAGFLSGLTGAVGVLFNSFYFRHGLTRDQVIATRAANELLLHVIKLALYLALGLLTRPVWLTGAAVALGALLATAVARRVVRHLPERAFQRLGYAAMVVSGLFMLGSSVQRLRRSHDLGIGVTTESGEVELSGWWSGGSVTLEWEMRGGLAVEHQVRPEDLPAAVQQVMRDQAHGRRLRRAEVVYEWSGRAYELEFDDGRGSIETIEIPMPREETP